MKIFNFLKNKKDPINSEKKYSKEQYFLDNDFEFKNNDIDCQYFCELSCIDEKTAETTLAYVKLSFDDSLKLIRKERFFEGKLGEVCKLTEEEKKYTYLETPINKVGHLTNDKNGINQFGGNPPKELEIPMLDGTTVSYIGTISKNEKTFPWLENDLHLIAPTFYNYDEPIFVDYSNPILPKFINKEIIEENDFCDKEAMLNINPIVSYSEHRYNFETTNINAYIDKPTCGYFGVPGWDHQPILPYCPKTGHKMKLLFYTHGIHESKLLSEVPEEINQGSEEDLFFGGGSFHVFYCPESKVICYFAQYT